MSDLRIINNFDFLWYSKTERNSNMQYVKLLDPA